MEISVVPIIPPSSRWKTYPLPGSPLTWWLKDFLATEISSLPEPGVPPHRLQVPSAIPDAFHTDTEVPCPGRTCSPKNKNTFESYPLLHPTLFFRLDSTTASAWALSPQLLHQQHAQPTNLTSFHLGLPQATTLS